MVLADANGMIDVVDPVVREDGFCISNKEESIWAQSHMLCFYGDTLLSMVLFYLSRHFQGNLTDAAMRPINDNIIGTVGHGFAHFFIALNPLDPT